MLNVSTEMTNINALLIVDECLSKVLENFENNIVKHIDF